MKQETKQKGEMYMPTRDEINKSIFNEGANWQKEQDKAIIEELIDSLNTIINIKFFVKEFSHGSIDKKAKEAIEKALNHIKTN